MSWECSPIHDSYRQFSSLTICGIWLLDSNCRNFGYKESTVMGSEPVGTELHECQLRKSGLGHDGTDAEAELRRVSVTAQA